MPFHTFSRPIRRVENDVYGGLVSLGMVPTGFGETESVPFMVADAAGTTLRDRALRFEMLSAYGAACVFTGNHFPSLDGNRFGVDVGHCWPRSAGGPSIIQNVLPMCKDVNYLWDEGIISLTDDGDLLLARNANPSTRLLLANFQRIRFPVDARLWPDAKFLDIHRRTIFEIGPTWIVGHKGPPGLE